MTDHADAQLAAQYEAYPYPARDPREEAKRLIIGSPSHLREIDYWVFGARRPTSQPLRALMAGGGTGDGLIMLATHLARSGRPGRVTYLDRSAAAMKVARARAEVRGLANIDWVQGSLLDLPQLGLGLFDCITCPRRPKGWRHSSRPWRRAAAWGSWSTRRTAAPASIWCRRR
jgi:2-polyprenyl-3-methyl-5-hydroxy-6-metoxy-1,4-benzoquinol methylase